jgi:hypothetical protein
MNKITYEELAEFISDHGVSELVIGYEYDPNQMPDEKTKELFIKVCEVQNEFMKHLYSIPEFKETIDNY